MPRACVPPRNTCFMVYMPEPGANESATSNSDQRRHARETRAGFAAADQDDEQGVGRPAAETTSGESGREEIDDANSVQRRLSLGEDTEHGAAGTAGTANAKFLLSATQH